MQCNRNPARSIAMDIPLDEVSDGFEKRVSLYDSRRRLGVVDALFRHGLSNPSDTSSRGISMAMDLAGFRLHCIHAGSFVHGLPREVQERRAVSAEGPAPH